jgi:putative secretion ATPase (PEP-CTERM system associated)
MYEEYFGFNNKPFQITPDPEFLYLSKTHKKAMNYLNYGIRENSGFILITGEIGTGKTTIIRSMMKALPGNVHLARINNTRVDSDLLISMINDEFGLGTMGKGKIELLRDLNDFLINQYAERNQCVLVVDEAQNLSSDLIEEVRLLSNLETDKSKLLQIILVGQPELRATLSRPELEQLSQRITVSCHLRPLVEEELEGYIRHRMAVAGNQNAVSFEPGVISEIFKFSGGRPRLINVICDYALLSAFTDQVKVIGLKQIREIVEELAEEKQSTDTVVEKEVVGRERTVLVGDIESIKERLTRLEMMMSGLGMALLDKFLKGPELAAPEAEPLSGMQAVENSLMELLERKRARMASKSMEVEAEKLRIERERREMVEKERRLRLQSRDN